jgi:hypothetical protein
MGVADKSGQPFQLRTAHRTSEPAVELRMGESSKPDWIPNIPTTLIGARVPMCLAYS